MNIAVTGSSGLIGGALVPQLEKSGHRVTRLVRAAPRSADEVQWNPESDEDVALPHGTDAVIHLAGANISQRWTKSHKTLIRSSRVETTKRLSAQVAAMPSPPRVFLCASAVGVYGERGDETTTEESALGEGFRAEVCRDWEDATRAASDVGIRVVNLRFGIVLSARGGALRKMLPAFRLGVGGRLGNGRQFWSWVALDDAIRATVFALENESIRGPINITSPQPVTNREFAQTLARVLARPALFPVPAWALHLALGEMADEAVLSSARVLPVRLQNAGFSFLHENLESALRHVLRR